MWKDRIRSGRNDYFVEEDFNGDGQKYVALILVSETNEKLVIFQKKGNMFVPVHERDNPIGEEYSPATFYIGLLPKGKITGLQECDEETGCKDISLTTHNACLEIGVYEIFSAILCHQKNDEFGLVWIGQI